MTAWNTSDNRNTLSREEAIEAIQEKATEQGINGVFKVYYDNAIVADPANLPDRVDMTLIRVSASLDQAIG